VTGAPSLQERREIAQLTHHIGYQFLIRYLELYLEGYQQGMLDEDEPVKAMRKLRHWQTITKVVQMLKSAPDTILEELDSLPALPIPEFETYYTPYKSNEE
jgi:hypothetical protein